MAKRGRRLPLFEIPQAFVAASPLNFLGALVDFLPRRLVACNKHTQRPQRVVPAVQSQPVSVCAQAVQI